MVDTNNQPESISPDIHEQCQKELHQCRGQIQEWKDKAVRLAADFENHKRRLEKDQIAWQRAVQSKMLLDILTVLDNFDRAFKDSPDAQRNQGFALIYKELKKMLENYGVTEITQLQQFDPTLHEAIMNVAVPGKEHGAIVDVLQKGYYFKDQILRPAKVSIVE